MGFRRLLLAALAAVLVSITDGDGGGGGLCAANVLIHGYKCQEFDVTTDDGYILSVQRIPQGRSGGGHRRKKPPVLLQHGLLADGTTWVMNSPEESLPMILADNGFDVWIVNTRGTAYSRRHLFLNTFQQKYWDWSWDELAAHDFPTAINFVYNKTGHQKINYIGHSLGTLIALAALSEGNQINKLRSASLLSPIAYLSHMKTGLGNIAARSLLSEAYKFMGIAEFDPLGFPVKEFVKMICNQPGANCYDLLSGFTGNNCCLNTSTFHNFIETEPQPSSSKNMMHLAQTVRSGILSKYDYVNPIINLFHYGQFWPPVYNLANIPRDFPLFLSYGGNDDLSDTVDVNNLLDILKDHDTDKIFTQQVENYGHIDFILAVNAKDVVFNQIVKFLKKRF
ncbi:triacylglycerol lipase 2-like [Impatiens glandulifera]|uniref:triacylglycerol lipase 2-like n=1 Tax=Impatiens glandulifera TaxID=253017 RepID=UPI001FB08A42|nr:triacylglycerol lipase 2-like [Impatiens glandulifera]